MKIHHIGYLVKDIENAASEFEKLGFSQLGDVMEDLSRDIYILFLENGGYTIELVQPISIKSPYSRLLKKYSNSMYHICYETDDLEREIKNIVKTEGCVLIQQPEPAMAISGCPNVAFIMDQNIGLIKLIQFTQKVI